jgi:Ca2+-binding RTX toxin-like protein
MVTGTDFNDALRGDDLANTLSGGFGGDDVLEGRGGDDRMQDGAGNDTFLGGAGNDYMSTDFSGLTGNDYVDGGTGVDTLDYHFLTSFNKGITLNLGVATAQNTSGAGTDTVLNVENVTGTRFIDHITGNAAANYIDGWLGKDVLSGLGGDDTLISQHGGTLLGGTGNDTLYWGGIMDGGAGNDLIHANGFGNAMTGGLGTDAFIYAGPDTTAYTGITDTIFDFSRAQGDKIDLHALGVINGTGALPFIGGAAFTSSPGHPELRVVSGASFQTVEADFNGDRIADIVIHVNGSTPLIASDFIL